MIGSTVESTPDESLKPEAQFGACDCINVLIVDDDPDFLDLLTFEMRQIPRVAVTVAHGPEDAVRCLTKNEFQLVVSDWALSDSTAPEVFSHADHALPSRSYSDAKVPVLFMSGSEKVNETRILHGLKHFEPVSFILKRCGPALISVVAEHILARFTPANEGLC